MKKYIQYVGIIGLFTLISYLYVWSFVRTGLIYVSSDRIFHLERLEEVYRTMKSGHLLSYISTYSAARVGIATGQGYPSVNLIIYGLIRLILVKSVVSYYSYIMVEQFLGLIVAFYAGWIFFKGSKKSALIFAVILRTSAYVMHNDYGRADIGEAWALIFVPLALIGYYLITARKEYIKGAIILSLGLSLELYSHILTAAITILFLIGIYILHLLGDRKSVVIELKSLICSVILFALESLVILVPLIDLLRKDIATPGSILWDNYDYSPLKLVKLSLTNSIGMGSENIGIILLLLTFIGIFFWGKIPTNIRKIYIISTLLLVLITNIFPWSLLQNTPLRIIQFPWRLLAIIIVLLSVCSVVTLNNMRMLKVWGVVLVTITSITSVVVSEQNFISNEKSMYHIARSDKDIADPWDKLINSINYNKMLSINQTADTNKYFTYNDYNKKSARENDVSIFNHEVSIGDYRKSISNKDIESGYQEVTYKLRNLPTDGGKLTLPFVIYDKNNYKVYLNDRKVEFYENEYSQLQVIKDKNLQNMDVKVKYFVPVMYKVANVVSFVVSGISILFLLYIEYKNKKKQGDFIDVK